MNSGTWVAQLNHYTSEGTIDDTTSYTNDFSNPSVNAGRFLSTYVDYVWLIIYMP